MKYNSGKSIIDYKVFGEGIPVLLLHGFFLDKRVMVNGYEPLFEKIGGYKRYYLDLPAMGESEPLDIETTDDIYQCVKGFVLNVIGEEFVLIGFSYGGYLSLKLAVEIPDMIKGLSLLCPMVNPDFATRILPELRRVEYDKDYFDNLIGQDENKEDYFEMSVVSNEYTYKRFLTDMIPGLDVARYDILEGLQKNHYGFSVNPINVLKGFDNPCLFLVGKQDNAVGYRELVNYEYKFTSSSIHIIDGAGHALLYEQKETFDFLTSNWMKMMKEK